MTAAKSTAPKVDFNDVQKMLNEQLGQHNEQMKQQMEQWGGIMQQSMSTVTQQIHQATEQALGQIQRAATEAQNPYVALQEANFNATEVWKVFEQFFGVNANIKQSLETVPGWEKSMNDAMLHVWKSKEQIIRQVAQQMGQPR